MTPAALPGVAGVAEVDGTGVGVQPGDGMFSTLLSGSAVHELPGLPSIWKLTAYCVCTIESVGAPAVGVGFTWNAVVEYE